MQRVTDPTDDGDPGAHLAIAQARALAQSRALLLERLIERSFEVCILEGECDYLRRRIRDDLEVERQTILKSASWRITEPARRLNGVVRSLVRALQAASRR
jgi:hypothetical protein